MLYNTADFPKEGGEMEKKSGKQKPSDEALEEQMTEEEQAEEQPEEVTEVQALEEKVAELEDKLLREHADFQNIKKRMEKEKAQAVAYAHEQFARDLLSVIDALEQAKQAVEGKDETTPELLEQIKEGIDLTLAQFSKIFEKHGIELVTFDEGFDPNFHEAVMQVDSDQHKEGEIVQVLQKGYKIKDRLLRSAMVSVAK